MYTFEVHSMHYRGFTRVSLHLAVTRDHLLSREGKLAPDGERRRHLLGKGGTHCFVDKADRTSGAVIPPDFALVAEPAELRALGSVLLCGAS